MAFLAKGFYWLLKANLARSPSVVRCFNRLYLPEGRSGQQCNAEHRAGHGAGFAERGSRSIAEELDTRSPSSNTS